MFFWQISVEIQKVTSLQLVWRDVKVISFADDNHIIGDDPNLARLIEDTKKKIETKQLRNSGLMVNEDKTEVCLYYKTNHP